MRAGTPETHTHKAYQIATTNTKQISGADNPLHHHHISILSAVEQDPAYFIPQGSLSQLCKEARVKITQQSTSHLHSHNTRDTSMRTQFRPA